MTSTVLDVTLFLLCVSAGVVTVTGVTEFGGSGEGTQRPDAGAVADLVATSTASVTYDSVSTTAGETSGDAERSVTHHATLAELLATAAGMVAIDPDATTKGGSPEALAAYEAAVVKAVRSAVGTRTQVVAYRASNSSEDVLGAEAVDDAVVAGLTPPPDAAIDVATIRVPVSQVTLGPLLQGDDNRSVDRSGDRGGTRSEFEQVRIVVRVW